MNEAIPLSHTQNEDFSLDTFRSSYLELFYATLFHPLKTFRLVGAEGEPGGRLIFFGLITVVFISTLAPLVHMASQGGEPAALIWKMPVSAIVGTLIWAFTALLISLAAYAFTGESRIRTSLALSGLATLPWIFMGPVCIFKMGVGTVGLVIFVVLALLIWLWSVLLFGLALAESYRMTPDRVMIVLAVPFAVLLVQFGWLGGFINNVRHLLVRG